MSKMKRFDVGIIGGFMRPSADGEYTLWTPEIETALGLLRKVMAVPKDYGYMVGPSEIETLRKQMKGESHE